MFEIQLMETCNGASEVVASDTLSPWNLGLSPFLLAFLGALKTSFNLQYF